MIEKLAFKFGSSKTSKPLEIKPGFMNVLVGPNNSGKSHTLLELGKYYEASVDKPLTGLLGLRMSKSNIFDNKERNPQKINRNHGEFKIVAELELRIPSKGEFRKQLRDALILDIEKLKGGFDSEKDDSMSFIVDMVIPILTEILTGELIKNNRHLLEDKADLLPDEKVKLESEFEDSLNKLTLRSEKIMKKIFGLVSNLEKIDIWKLLDSFIKVFETEDLDDIKKFIQAIKAKFDSGKENVFLELFEYIPVINYKNLSEIEKNELKNKFNKAIGKEIKIFDKPFEHYISLFFQKTNEFFDFVESKSTIELLDILLDNQVMKLSSYDSLCKEYILSIDGENRFEFVREQALRDFSILPSNQEHFMKFLHKDGNKRLDEFRKVIKDFFGFFPVFDLRNNSNIKLTFSKEHPGKHELRRDEDESKEFLEKNTIPISNFSHGRRATTGILSKVISSEYNLLLIDEPDAFLHPPLAKRLGKYLTNYTSEQDGNTFVATHSSDFLMGCIESGKEVNIIRLTHSDNESTVRCIDFKELKILMSDPLVRSTQFLNSLFYQGVVICEADADRVFYNEIYQKLLNSNSKECIDSIVFLNAQNKPTVRRIVNPLRKMGIPAVAVVDIDIISNGEDPNGNDFSDLLDACFVNPEDKDELDKIRLELFEYFKTVNKKEKRVNI
ncbi:MAG TPA: hypothetical protein PLX69_21470 [Leptospiraceae bacterium]|nr:hypothetical protein [Leptospiraceae bacterium]